MLPVVAVIGAFTGFGMLLISGLAHLRHPVAFKGNLARQAVWPDRLVWPLAGVVVAAEVSLGAVGLVALAAEIFGPSRVLAEGVVMTAAAGAATIYTLFAVYSAYLVRHRPEVPCGCSMSDHPVDWTVVGRAAVLAVACGAVALAPFNTVAAHAASPQGLLLVLESAVFMVLAWSLPAALRNPDRIEDK